jgi:hypothetical protein
VRWALPLCRCRGSTAPLLRLSRRWPASAALGALDPLFPRPSPHAHAMPPCLLPVCLSHSRPPAAPPARVPPPRDAVPAAAGPSARGATSSRPSAPGTAARWGSLQTAASQTHTRPTSGRRAAQGWRRSRSDTSRRSRRRRAAAARRDYGGGVGCALRPCVRRLRALWLQCSSAQCFGGAFDALRRRVGTHTRSTRGVRWAERRRCL